MNSTTISIIFTILFGIASLGSAQLEAPSISRPPEDGLPTNFRRPSNLIFAFECGCYFNRISIPDISEFEMFRCDQRAAAIADNPGLGRCIASQCERNFGHFTDLTAENINGATDLIFSECSNILYRLFPDDPVYQVTECTCFFLQTGKVPTTNPHAICNDTWDEVTRQNRRIRRSRCRENIRFKDFTGENLGVTGRRCFLFGYKNCCYGLPNAGQ